ncbi:hypothetical protein HY29_13420 [Hyphomonas beringensis]|uniref:HTH marR-type domain-containing protein n=1 Tax=Hyphomonas beringensis TaxID=1280946 RepID=A0A062UAP5_9PROT|nr:MarR family winged helix-turn-helix transcriptional regulator [Hyphomonas beringensis]KCZ54793.1 hypothetical protein HY29_13420 [Hyphomonas beringensis]
MSETYNVTPENQILLNLLSGFYWLDEGLQSYIRARGWPTVTRPQSMVMANILMGVRYPSDIARRLGVSRQAIHATLKTMGEMDMVRLVDDPNNMRVKVVELTETGEAMRGDAQQAMALMTQELQRRLGQEAFAQTAATLAEDWGAPLSFTPEDVARD